MDECYRTFCRPESQSYKALMTVGLAQMSRRLSTIHRKTALAYQLPSSIAVKHIGGRLEFIRVNSTIDFPPIEAVLSASTLSRRSTCSSAATR